MLFFSHWLDLVGKLLSIAGVVVILVKTGLGGAAERLLASSPNPRFFFFIVVLGLGAVWYFAIHRPLVDVLMTQLYVRLRFGVSPSWSEAKQLRRLFCLNMMNLQWQPMDHVKSLDRHERLPALLAAAKPS
ncbi:MAG: hypothetical protein NTV51_06935 [Verrucomicrobia bacterium]|nr:hypothetical protein [Verrucomicrobiota bacterium]